MEKTAAHGIKFKDKMGYAMGDMGGLLTFALVAPFLQMFYTDVLHIELEKIATLLVAARIWDAVNDPMWGAFIDSRRPTKRGRFRPYILGASIPLAVAGVLMFTKIPGLTETQYLIFAYITYIFYGMMYTGVNIPYGSLASVITDDEKERSSLSMWRSIGAGIGGLPAQVLLPLLVFIKVDGSDTKVLDYNKFFICTVVLALLSVAVLVSHYKLTKERVALPPKQTADGFSIVNSVKALIKNRPYIALCLTSMLFMGCQSYTQTMLNYLFNYYYKQPGLYSLVTVCTYLPMGLLLPFMGKLVTKYGKKEICSLGFAVCAVFNIILFALRGTPLAENAYFFIALSFFSGAGQTFFVLEVWALVMDVIDYHEVISSRREEGVGYSFFSFGRKIGTTLAGAGSSLMLKYAGYDVKSTVGQTAQVAKGIYDISTAVPAVMFALMFAIMFFAYSLNRDKTRELYKKLQRE
ncbi:MAG: glycoside-pentoside-hexuronide (GPH):cation symporter [Clostridia bacterium]|nr:glycoside-pentoside-hexuronide (GPH):cation symporter [Clostridia bacterium]